MKFSSLSLFLLAVVGTNADVASTFSPYRVSFDSLADDIFDESLVDALSQVGVVSVRDIPGYAAQRKNTLSALTKCAQYSDASKAATHRFSDGTVRKTFATRTIPGPGGAQVIPGVQDHEECRQFEEASSKLRSIVDEVTRAFAIKVASILDGGEEIDSNPSSLLKTKDGFTFSTFADVVENGEHLEHFHHYRSETDTEDGTKTQPEENTIDFHTDQGLFIAFTPSQSTVASASGAGAFYITQKNGSKPEVIFNDSDLVLMLGDGVNQFVNPHQERYGRKLQLRATPHAMRMPAGVTSIDRTWHGRMVLPPTDAVHQETGKTFGEFRQLMIDASLSTEGDQEDALAIGCSGNAVARQLEEASCAEGSTYCWHRCMEHADHGISVDHCNSLGQPVQCINPRGQFSDGDKHGDFFPACSDSTEVATDYPTLPGYPRDMNVCDMASWDAFADSTGYDFSFDDLGDNQGRRGYHEGYYNGKGGGKVAKFMWSVTDDDKIDGKLVFHGGFGYLSMGFAHPEGKHNGMNGASVIMAIPGGNYSARLGLDLEMDENVQEYVIDLSGSSFRHWSNPLPDRNTSTYAVTTDDEDCFTSLTFTTDNINDIKFNVSGTDDLVWAGNLKDYFCGSHGRGQEGRGDRDRFMVEWKTGKAWFPVPPMEGEEEDDVGPAPAPTTTESKEPEVEGQSTGHSSNGPVGAIILVVASVVSHFFG